MDPNNKFFVIILISECNFYLIFWPKTLEVFTETSKLLAILKRNVTTMKSNLYYFLFISLLRYVYIHYDFQNKYPSFQALKLDVTLEFIRILYQKRKHVNLVPFLLKLWTHEASNKVILATFFSNFCLLLRNKIFVKEYIYLSSCKIVIIHLYFLL